MTDGRVHCELADGVAHIRFDRPAARNAMTWHMYDELRQACQRISGDPSVSVAVLRGVGGEAFVAGTDINQFTHFHSGEDGLKYERGIDEVIDALERVPVPTIAAVDGWCMGGGLLIAAACDFRVASRSARFGAPMARTIGNCLSMANTRRLVASLGVANAKRVLMAAQVLDGAACLQSGFVHECVEPEGMDQAISGLCARLKQHAPGTMWAAKEMMRRIVAEGSASGDDVVHSCYGSDDFREGVASFLDKRAANWSPRRMENSKHVQT
jgi:enoyl-CoA hydratase/carnithine racemase